MEREFIGLNIAVLAVTESSAEAMKLVAQRLGEAGHVVSQGSIEDSVQLIRARLLEYIADPGTDVVIVLSGVRTESAGIALDPLITRGLNGFSDLLRMIAYHEIGSAAMLVDAEAAECKSTFVFVLPASVSQVKIALDKLLLPQLDYRTQPKNLVMQMPRIAHADPGREDAAVVASVKETNTAPMPWITPRLPGEPAVPPPRPTAQLPAVRKSMSMSVAEAMPSPSASMSQVLSKVSAAVSVSQQLPVASSFETREPTDVGAPPAPPPVPRGKTTISVPLPIKPPAKLIPLATLVPVPDVVAASPVEPVPERKMSSLADLEDDGDDLDELDNGVAEIVDEPPRADPPLAARVMPDDLPPPRRAEDSLPPLYDDSPRRIAEPRAPRRRDGKALALVLLGLLLVAATVVLVVVFVERKDREARAATTEHGALVATRDPAPPPADPRPPTETQAPPPEVQTGGTELSTEPAEPTEIEMPPADSAPTPVKQPATQPAKVPKAPRTPREPQADAVHDPADVLATAPVNKVEDGCDEVSCILDKYKQACCARFKPAEVEPPPEKPATGLPEKLDKLMVQEGLASVKPAVIACGERVAARGTVKVQVKVSPSGKILSVGVASAPDPELGTCVAGAVKLAKFPETDEGGSFGYPFVF